MANINSLLSPACDITAPVREGQQYAGPRKGPYTDYAGLEISVISCIASLFSLLIANVNAGPVLALESMGAKQYFRCHSLNIALKYKQ